MVRLLTALAGSLLFLAAVFYLGDLGFFVFLIVPVLGAAWEFCRIVRHWAPQAPFPLLLALLIPVAYGLSFAAGDGRDPAVALPLPLLLSASASLVLVAACAVLFSRTPVEQSLPGIAGLVFGTLYFAVPTAAMVHLHRMGWAILLLATAIVWVGDAAALYAGRAWGRHKLAPVVSPNKSWEGAVAAVVTAVLLAAGWSWWQMDRLDWPLMVLAAAVSVAAQCGDLVESLFKRGAHIKDSGHILPGHGGLYDRLDALLFGAPAMVLGLWLIGPRP